MPPTLDKTTAADLLARVEKLEDRVAKRQALVEQIQAGADVAAVFLRKVVDDPSTSARIRASCQRSLAKYERSQAKRAAKARPS
jgi:hypothetical protein